MDGKILGVGPRTAVFLHRVYAKPRAKLIARDFRVSVGTAERWLAGEAPTVRHVEEMTAMFGKRYVRAVFAEAFYRQDERIRILEYILAATFMVGGMAGLIRDMSWSSGFLPNSSIFGDWISWVSRLLGIQSSEGGLELLPDPARTALIEGLLKTVPASLQAPH